MRISDWSSDVCSSDLVITVQLQDANGNPVNAGVGGQAFTAVSNSTGTVSWFTDDACVASTLGGFTIPAGSNSVNVFYQDTRAATPRSEERSVRERVCQSV